MNRRLGRLSIAGLLAVQIAWAATVTAAPTLGPVSRVTEGNPGCQQEPVPVPLRSGGFAVAWNHWYEKQALLRIADAQGKLLGSPVSFADRRVNVMGSDAEGRLVLVWQVEPDLAYRLQRLTATGNPLGPEVDLPIPGSLQQVGGAVAPDGSFALTWQDGQRIAARWFSPQGAPLGPEIEIDHFSTVYNSQPPAAAIDTVGRLVAAWSRPTQPAPQTQPRVRFRRFDTAGNATGPAVDVNAGDPDRTTEWTPTLAALRDGGIAIAWQNGLSSTEPEQSIRLRLFDAANHPAGAPIDASLGEPGYQPRLSSDLSGSGDRIALAWLSGTDRKGWMRLLTATGVSEPPIRLHPEALLGSEYYDDESPVPTFLTSGRIGVTWYTHFDTGFLPTGCEDLGIFERVVDPTPAIEPPRADGPEVLISGSGSLDARIALAPDGGWLALWQTGVFGRVISRGFDAAGQPRGPAVPLTPSGATGGYELALSALPNARFVAAWVNVVGDQPVTVLRLEADGRPAGPAVSAPDSQGARNLHLAAGDDGRFLVAWTRPQDPGEIQVLPFLADGSTTEVPLAFPAAFGSRDKLDLEAHPAGGYLLAWSEGEAKIYVLRLNRAAEPTSFPLLASLDNVDQGLPQVAPDVDGGFAVAWSAVLPPFPATSAVRLRRFTREGFPREGVIEVQALQDAGDGSPRVLYAADLSSSRDGILWVLLNRQEAFDGGGLSGLAVINGIPVGPPVVIAEAASYEGTSVESADVAAYGCGWLVGWSSVENHQSRSHARRFTGGCPGVPGALALNGGRFRAEVAWRTRDGQSGIGQALPLTDDTGAFWFFGPDNLELMLKVLDGRALNGAFWVFYATLTDVEFELRVTDQLTGDRKVYSKPAGRLESRADVGAFPVGTTLAAPPLPRRWEASEATAADLQAEGSCVSSSPADTALCLLGQRFRVSVRFTDPRDGSERQALAHPLTADSGSFWFFAPDNLELMVKLVDGRTVNDHFWFFSAGLSDVDYEITVTDTQTGIERVYTHPRGKLESRADTSAFDAREGAGASSTTSPKFVPG